jgi:hypothetical protein
VEADQDLVREELAEDRTMFASSLGEGASGVFGNAATGSTLSAMIEMMRPPWIIFTSIQSSTVMFGAWLIGLIRRSVVW